jgi:hypothetical protein
MRDTEKKLAEEDFLVRYDRYIHGKLTYQELHDLPEASGRKQQLVVRNPSRRAAKR